MSIFTFGGSTSSSVASAHQSVLKSAASGSHAKTLANLEHIGIYAAVASCFELAQHDLHAFKALAAYAAKATGNQWARFCVHIARYGTMPTGLSGRMTASFYESARKLILLARAEKKVLISRIGWIKGEQAAKQHLFYPEYLIFNHRRGRICLLALTQAAGQGPGDDRQVILFSLGGLYDWNVALSGTRLQGTATSCFLVARSILQATGCNIIGPKTNKSQCRCQSLQELPGPMRYGIEPTLYGWTWASKYDGFANGPKPGDVYLIRGKQYTTSSGTQADSGHVGIVVATNGKSWTTVDGGATDHVTTLKQKTLVKAKGKSQIPGQNWTFANDNHKAGERVIYGWLDVDKFSKSVWMKGA